MRIGPAHEGTLSSNRAAAESDAAQLLSKIRLPAGAVRVSREMPGDSGFLKAQPALVRVDALAGAHRWWVVEGDPAGVIAYFEAHNPIGSKRVETGSGGNLRTGTSGTTVGYQWPGVGAAGWPTGGCRSPSPR